MLPTLSEMTRVFGRIGVLSFGGPAAQIALMEDALVTQKNWLTASEFLRALGFCTLLPGPEAMQLATYAGWRLRGTVGGLLAGGLFVLPGAAVMVALTYLYLRFGAVPGVQAAFLGVKATVLVIVAQALRRLGQKALKLPLAWVLAAMAFGVLVFDLASFPVVLGIAAVAGIVGLAPPLSTSKAAPPTPIRQSITTVALWVGIWWIPLLALWFTDASGILWEISVFFSWLAIVSFGGAYAVLAYMADFAVHAEAWLDAPQMIDGLGLAETTPGPLILVTVFVGILAGTNAGGLGLAAAGVTLWATFVPCFLWVFAGAPYVERLASAPKAQGALAGITAAVAGVIASLGLWFGMNVLFTPDVGEASIWARLVPEAVALSAAAAVLMVYCRLGLLTTLVIMAALGWGLGQFGAG